MKEKRKEKKDQSRRIVKKENYFAGLDKDAFILYNIMVVKHKNTGNENDKKEKPPCIMNS